MKKLTKILCFIVFGLMMSFSTSAQNKTFLFGISPKIVKKPYYQKGEKDINVLPFVYQQGIFRQVEIRVSPILNYGIRKTNSEINYFGIQIAFPYFPNKRDNLYSPFKGLYFAPGLELARNTFEKYKSAEMCIESGYTLLFDNDLAISVGLQFGATRLNYDNDVKEWKSHFGVKFIFGKWF